MKLRSITALAAASALTVTLSVTPAQAHSNNHHPQPKPPLGNITTLTDGLISPLKVAFGPHGSLLVAESFAGQLTSISKTGVKRVLVRATGTEIAGVSHANGTTYYFQNSSPAEGVAGPAELKTIDRWGKHRTVTDLLNFEKKYNPDGKTVYGVRYVSKKCLAKAPYMQSMGELYSHPYSTAPGRDGLYVGDAGANMIVKVSDHGKVKLVKALPAERIKITKAVQAAVAQMGMVVPDCMLGLNYYAQPVPTDIEVKGSWLYYTVLPGAPGESLSMGKAYRVNLKSHRTELLAQGLSAPTGIAVDRKGNVYLSQLMGAGISKIVRGKAVTVLPAMTAADVEISGNMLAATTNALAEPPMTGNVVTARIR